MSTTNSSFNVERPLSIGALLYLATALRATVAFLKITVATPVDLPFSLYERVTLLVGPTV